MTALGPVGIAGYVLIGVALGSLYFALLFRTVGMLARRRRSYLVASLYMIRLAAVVAALWIIAQQGPVPLLSAAVGFVAARWLIWRRLGSN